MSDWYKISSDEALKNLETTVQGLSNLEAQRRLAKFGKNVLPQAKRFGVWLFLFEQIKSPLVFILIIAGFINLWIQEYFGTAVIFTSVAVNIGIGFYQEYSSSKILEHLQRLIKVNARVLRDDQTIETDSENLVPGDIVELKPGMKIPADIRLLKVKEFNVNEAILTGESNAVEKSTEPLDGDLVLGDRRNMAFTGTTVDRGEALGVVVETGSKTEIGKIAELTKKAEDEKTPLQERLEHLGKTITILVAFAAVTIFVVGLFEKLNIVEVFVTAVAVAVAAVPEGLPAALAVILAISSKKILATGGLVKKLIAAESLGSTSVICADKTGTLTEGKMHLEKIITLAGNEKMLTALALANEALVERSGNSFQIKGESTDYAKLKAFFDSGHSLDNKLKEMPRFSMIPFDSVNKYIASFHKLNDNQTILYISGAPEIFVNKSSHIEADSRRIVTLVETEKIKSDYESLAAQGFRMIGAGYKIIDEKSEGFTDKKQEELKNYMQDFTFLGLAAIRDPIREDVKEIMSEVKSAGLKVVMITGDHRLTAVSIGKELGLLRDEYAVMEGFELDKLTDEELKHVIRNYDIFARVDPIHKLRVVKAWKEAGESVAATGDGINDAPALKTADVGIAVASGTDVTKEAADLVLMNDNFVTIIEAIRQGRTAFFNIRKVTIFLVSNSFTELILILSALVLRIPLPLTAIQILWTNLVENGLPNFALAFEPSEKKVMKRKPIERKVPILDREGKVLSFPLGIATSFVLFGIYTLFLDKTGYSIHYIRTFVFAALGTDTLFYVFSLRSLDHSIFKTNLFQNKYLLIAVGVGFLMMGSAIYAPFFNKVLDTEPLITKHLFWVALLGIYKIVIVEVVKWFYNRKSIEID